MAEADVKSEADAKAAAKLSEQGVDDAYADRERGGMPVAYTSEQHAFKVQDGPVFSGGLSRSLPLGLDVSVHDALADELAEVSEGRRPRGRSGLLHDRKVAYLSEVVGSCVTLEGSGRLAVEEGVCVALRFTGDVEHRSYFVKPDGGREAPDGAPSSRANLDAGRVPGAAEVSGYLSLPSSWPLAEAVAGLQAGDTAEHVVSSREGERSFNVHVLAVWHPSTPVWRLSGIQDAVLKEAGGA